MDDLNFRNDLKTYRMAIYAGDNGVNTYRKSLSVIRGLRNRSPFYRHFLRSIRNGARLLVYVENGC